MPGQQGNLNGSTILYDEQISRYVSETQKDTNHKMTFPFSRETKKDLLEQAINKHPVYRNLAMTLDNGGESTISSGLLKDIIIEQYLLVDQDLPNPAISDAQRIPYIDIAVLNKIVMIVKETDIDAAMNGLVTNDLGIKREIASAVQQGEMYGMSLEKVLEQDKESVYKVFEVFKPEENSPLDSYTNYSTTLDALFSENINPTMKSKVSEYLIMYQNDKAKSEEKGLEFDDSAEKRIGIISVNGHETNAIMTNKSEVEIFKSLDSIHEAMQNGDRQKAEELLNGIKEKYKDDENASRFLEMMTSADGQTTVESSLQFREQYIKTYNIAKILDGVDEDRRKYGNNIDLDSIPDDKEREAVLKRLAVMLISYEKDVKECSARRIPDYKVNGMSLDKLIEQDGKDSAIQYVIGELESYKGKPIKAENGYAELFYDQKFLSINNTSKNKTVLNYYEASMDISGEYKYPEDLPPELRRMYDKAYKESSAERKKEYDKIVKQGLGVDKQQYEIGKYIDSFDLSNNGTQGAADVKRLLLELYNREFVRVYKREPSEEDYYKHTIFSGRSEFEKAKEYLKNNYPDILQDIMGPEKEDKRRVFKRYSNRDLVFRKDAPQRIMDEYRSNGHERVGKMVHLIEYASEKGYDEQRKLEDKIQDYQIRLAAFMKYEGKEIPPGKKFQDNVSQVEVTAENYEQRKKELEQILQKMPPEFFVSERAVAFAKDMKTGDMAKVYKEMVVPRKRESDEAIKKRLQEDVKITKDAKVESKIKKYEQPVNFYKLGVSMLQRAINLQRVRKERPYEEVKSTDLMEVNNSFGARFSSWFSRALKSNVERAKQADDVIIYRANKIAETQQELQEQWKDDKTKDASMQVEQSKQSDNPWELAQDKKKEVQAKQKEIGQQALEHKDTNTQQLDANQEKIQTEEQSSNEQEL